MDNLFSKMLSEFKEGDHIQTQLIVGTVTKGIDKNNHNYLNIELKDSSGSIAAKKWNASDKDIELYSTGNVLFIKGDITKYDKSIQLNIVTATKVEEADIDRPKFVKYAPIPQEDLIKTFDDFVKSINNPTCKKVLEYFITKYDKQYKIYPAASNIHHEYMCGLLMHSTSMAKIANYLCTIYDDIDRDILITGTLLHDFGKIRELEGDLVFKYSLEGKLLGHISILSMELESFANQTNTHNETITLLEHMVLSHHGEYEFGSPVLPCTKEAIMLNLIDNLDSKIVIVNKVLENVKEGEFSQKVFSLDNRILYKPKKEN